MTESVVVSIANGKLRGSFQRSSQGDDYYAFRGIPYAKPPVGRLRFKDPLPAESWEGVRDATVNGVQCVQLDILSGIIEGDENCLYMNVYTKSVRSSLPLRPVLMWVHGGAFRYCNGDDYTFGPDFFLRKDIVLVSINYRLGVFGFLNLEHKVAPGNQGLKDQLLALQWIRDNIMNFGGDPNNVTIFGQSAGAASVHYMALSPLARGLFHKVISHSGVALNTWARPPDNPKKFAYQLCALLGKNSQDPIEIINFLRTIDSKKLVETQHKLITSEESIRMILPFGPGVDDKSKNPLMPIDPAVAAEKSVQVPWLIGYVSREGLNILPQMKEDDFHELNINFEKMIHPHITELLKKYSLHPIELKRMYCNNQEKTRENYEKMVDLYGDMHIVEGIHRAVEIQVKKSCAPTYLYRFTFDKDPSLFKTMLNSTMSGACHNDELQHLFQLNIFEKKLFKPIENKASNRIMKQMIELWVNFATTGRPTPTTTKLIPFYWQPVNSTTVYRHLSIGEELRMDVMINLERRYAAHKNSRNKI